MAKLDDLKMFVFLSPSDIKPSVNTPGTYDIGLKIGHNHDDPDKTIPTKVFIQNIPVGLVEVKGELLETFRDVRLNVSEPVKVRIVRAGSSKTEDEIEVPASAIPQSPPKPSVPTTPKSDIELLTTPRDPDPTTGLFFLTFRVLKAGTLHITSSPSSVQLKKHGTGKRLVNMPGSCNVTPGVYEIYVGFTGTQVELKLQLDGGSTAKVLLRK
jgi:hypothetical protein